MDSLDVFWKKELQQEIVLRKSKGELLGLSVVESGFGSVLPTLVVANMAPNSPSDICELLNIGDQIIAINGISVVALPQATCEKIFRSTRNDSLVRLTVISSTPVVIARIFRNDVASPLGFSVQNGVICALLRGSAAERGGVRVGHRLVEINGRSVVVDAHEKIVSTLASAVGEITLKTMPASIFRMLTGQEKPVYF